MLPLSPTGYGDSPYQGLSAFAGNPMLISPQKLVEAGHLSPADLEALPHFPDDKVDFGPVIYHKTRLLNRAFANFHAQAPAEQRAGLCPFLRGAGLLAGRFCPVHGPEGGPRSAPLGGVGAGARDPAARGPGPLRQSRWPSEIENQKYRQWQFFEQWLALKAYANERGIRIIGDIPIFVAHGQRRRLGQSPPLPL